MKTSCIVIMYLLSGMLLFTIQVLAQEKPFEPRVDLSYFQTETDTPYLRLWVQKKMDRRFYPVAGIPITVYFNAEVQNSKIGDVVTDESGKAEIVMSSSLKAQWDTLDTFDFFASIAPSDSTEEVSESISITKARIRVMGVEDKEGKLIEATVERKAGSEWISVEDVDVRAFVKRQFGRLTIGDDTYSTNEDGRVGVEFSAYDIPGDSLGNLRIGCMIEDHEEFGNLVAYTTLPWGKPFVDDNSAFEKRTLWSARDKTPIWLLIFPNLIILGVWSTIVYLLFQIIRIKKLSKSN